MYLFICNVIIQRGMLGREGQPGPDGYTYMYVCICVRLYVCIYLSIYLCVYIYIYI